MASGKLGNADLSANTYTTIYTCPADTFTVSTLNILNRGNNTVTIRVAIADDAVAGPTDAEFIEYGIELSPKGVLERSGLVLNAGTSIVVWSNGVNISVVAFGIETTTL